MAATQGRGGAEAVTPAGGGQSLFPNPAEKIFAKRERGPLTHALEWHRGKLRAGSLGIAGNRDGGEVY